MEKICSSVYFLIKYPRLYAFPLHRGGVLTQINWQELGQITVYRLIVFKNTTIFYKNNHIWNVFMP